MPAKIHGRLATAQLPSTSSVSRTMYQVPAGRKATVTVCLVNATALSATVHMGLGSVDRDIPLDAFPGDCLEFGVSLAARASLERTGITLSAGQRILADAAAAGCYAHVWGVEEDAL